MLTPSKKSGICAIFEALLKVPDTGNTKGSVKNGQMYQHLMKHPDTYREVNIVMYSYIPH
jgi:hypothetical protein